MINLNYKGMGKQVDFKYMLVAPEMSCTMKVKMQLTRKQGIKKMLIDQALEQVYVF